MEQKEKEKLQVFTIELNEKETSEIVSCLMEFPAGRVYNLLRKMENQTMIQRFLPTEKKIFENNPDIPVIKKET